MKILLFSTPRYHIFFHFLSTIIHTFSDEDNDHFNSMFLNKLFYYIISFDFHEPDYGMGRKLVILSFLKEKVQDRLLINSRSHSELMTEFGDLSTR